MNTVLLFSMVFAGLGLLAFVFIYLALFKHKCIIFEYKNNNNKEIIYFSKIKRYRVIKKDNEEKIKIQGVKTTIPYNDAYTLPTKKKNFDLVLMKRGMDYFICDISDIGFGDKNIASFFPQPINYELKINFLNNIKDIDKSFSSRRSVLMSIGIVAFAIVAVTVVLIIFMDKLENIVPQAASLAADAVQNSEQAMQQLNETSEYIKNFIAPN